MLETKDKKEGFTFIFGIVIFMFMLIMMLLVIKMVSVSAQTQKIEDTVTSSALSSMTVDVTRFAINNEVILDNVDESYENLLEVTCDNLHLKRTGTKTEFSGASEVFGTVEDIFTVRKCIFYNVYSDGSVEIYEYGRDGHLSSTSHSTVSNTKTPKNEDVTNTSCYMEIEYPVSLMKALNSSELFDKTVIKGEYVSLVNIE